MWMGYVVEIMWNIVVWFRQRHWKYQSANDIER